MKLKLGNCSFPVGALAFSSVKNQRVQLRVEPAFCYPLVIGAAIIAAATTRKLNKRERGGLG